jgi:hypothetical protein
MFTDSDFAGCVRTGKSTSATCCMLGQHCVRTSSTTQSTVSLSSPEAEFYSLVKGSSIALGVQAVLQDMGVYVTVSVKCDASSGISLASRRGLGRARHVNTRYLWIQEKTLSKAVTILKEKGTENPADIGTKCVTEAGIEQAQERLKLFSALKMVGSLSRLVDPEPSPRCAWVAPPHQNAKRRKEAAQGSKQRFEAEGEVEHRERARDMRAWVAPPSLRVCSEKCGKAGDQKKDDARGNHTPLRKRGCDTSVGSSTYVMRRYISTTVFSSRGCVTKNKS